MIELTISCQSTWLDRISLRAKSISCGNSLFSKDYDPKFLECPLADAPETTLAYRAHCTLQEESSDDIVDNNMAAIVSSTKPISLRLMCDDVSKMDAKSFEVSNFPIQINPKYCKTLLQFPLATSRSNAYYYSIVHFHPHFSYHNICYCLDMYSD